MADVCTIPDTEPPHCGEYLGVYENGVVRLLPAVGWKNGTQVLVRIASAPPEPPPKPLGKVIIAGFGLPGRWVADIFDRHKIEYVIVEKNIETIEAQRKLGRAVIEGDVSDEQTLRAAGINEASILALTIPDEQAVIAATRTARRIKPDIYIVARTTYSSAGMKAAQFGADEVVKGEQVIARQFYEMMLRKVGEAPGVQPQRFSAPGAEA